jgi:hypothetical protein
MGFIQVPNKFSILNFSNLTHEIVPVPVPVQGPPLGGAIMVATPVAGIVTKALAVK